MKRNIIEYNNMFIDVNEVVAAIIKENNAVTNYSEGKIWLRGLQEPIGVDGEYNEASNLIRKIYEALR